MPLQARAWIPLDSGLGRLVKGWLSVATWQRLQPSTSELWLLGPLAAVTATPLEQVLAQWMTSCPPSWRGLWKTPGFGNVLLQSSVPGPQDWGGAQSPPLAVLRALAPPQHGARLPPPPTGAAGPQRQMTRGCRVPWAQPRPRGPEQWAGRDWQVVDVADPSAAWSRAWVMR